jgi:Kef-type K+ transport system membrane component KefB
VSSIPLLVGLLVLAYLGSFLVGGRTVRGVGLPSGLEYVALGFVLGPHVLDAIGADTLESFEPVVQVALGWLAFCIGLDFGFVGGKRVRAGSLAIGAVGSLLTGGAVAAAVWFTLRRFDSGLPPTERFLLSGGIGAACSETTRHAVRWVVERYDARGPLADRLDEAAHADDLFPLLAIAVLFALEPTRAVSVAVKVPLRDWPLATVGLGLVLGGGAALLARSELRLEDTWGVLFGVDLIAIGAATRLGLSTLTASFFVGLAVSAFSHHRRELRAMVAPTERPVMLPALLLAGARIDFHVIAALPWVAGAAIGARLAAKVVTGWAIAAGSAHARKAGPWLGLSLLSSGALAVSIGLAFALRFPGSIGDTVLAVAVATVTVGEFIGPVRMRAALQAAGEIEGSKGVVASQPQGREGIAA